MSMSLRLPLLLPALLLPACETTPVTYDNEAVDPRNTQALEQSTASRHIDVYRSQSEIQVLHRVIGEVRLSTDGRQSAQAIRNSFEREARSRNAQGVVVQDPADRPYGASSGPGFDQPREIVAVFIRYDEDRGAGYGSREVPASPYSSQGRPSRSYPPQQQPEPYSPSSYGR